MTRISISAESNYEVVFSPDWRSELASQLQKCAKVGIVISTQMRHREFQR